MRKLMLAAALALPGCVEQQIALKIGHPVDDVISKLGPPTQVSELGTRRRLYVWTKAGGASAAPAPMSDFRPVGEFVRDRHNYAAGKACAYRLVADQVESSGAWIVERAIDPGTLCT